MAKANKWHRSGHTFRCVNYIPIPVAERKHNKDKWKPKDKKQLKQLQKQRITEKKGSWWKKKLGKKDKEE